MTNVAIIQPNALTTPAADQLVKAFLAGRTPRTMEAYAEDMARFAKHLAVETAGQAMGHLISLSPGEGNAVLLGYRAAMVDSGLSPATVNRRLSAVRSAIKLARTLGMTNWTPEVDGVSVQIYRDTRGPGLHGTRTILNRASAQDAVKGARDVAIVRLMFDLGLRRGEVQGLDLDDIDAANRRLWIKGKGRTQKEQRTLPAATLAALETWIVARRTVAKAGEAAVFVGLGKKKRGERISGRSMHRLIAELGADVGIKTRPHGLRHASITAALDAHNGDIRAVQQHARHASPQTTMRYDDNRKDLAGKIAESLAAIL